MVSVLCWFVFGVGVLKLQPWARIGIIILSFIYIFDTLYPPYPVLRAIFNFNVLSLLFIVTELVLFESFIFFFADSKVKEQFKKGTPPKVPERDAANKEE